MATNYRWEVSNVKGRGTKFSEKLIYASLGSDRAAPGPAATKADTPEYISVRRKLDEVSPLFLLKWQTGSEFDVKIWWSSGSGKSEKVRLTVTATGVMIDGYGTADKGYATEETYKMSFSNIKYDSAGAAAPTLDINVK